MFLYLLFKFSYIESSKIVCLHITSGVSLWGKNIQEIKMLKRGKGAKRGNSEAWQREGVFLRERKRRMQEKGRGNGRGIILWGVSISKAAHKAFWRLSASFSPLILEPLIFKPLKRMV